MAMSLTPYSFRHIVVGLGRQLQIRGGVTVEGMESLGHWERGSSMPALYDSQSGVTDLSARTSIVSALAKGWSPAKNGELFSKYSKECVIESKPVKFTVSSHISKMCKRATECPLGSVTGLVVVAHSKRISVL